jgi:hypothetical protein
MSRCGNRIRYSMMTAAFIIVAMGLCLLCLGCGGHTTVNPPIPAPALNGNFNISAASLGTSGVNMFGGAVQTDSAGHVTGILHNIGSFLLCFGVQFDLPFTGTIDANGQLSATITSSNNQVVSLNGHVSPNGSSLSGGTYTVSGTGCAAGDQGTITGFQVQPFTGTYSGVFTPSPATTMNLILPLAQSTTPNVHGRFLFAPATATITGGSACGLASATLDTTSSFASGNTLTLNLMGSDGITLLTYAGVTLDGTTTLVRGQFNIVLGPCGGQGGLANLSRP